ncbi:MAG: outer membrane beta-barrel protein [Pontiella sp.]
MKRMIVAATLAGLSTVAYSEFELNDVEISGYIDMSMSMTDGEDGSHTTAGLDTYEIRFATELADGFSVEAHIAGDGDSDIELEQAFLTYSGVSNLTITAGKFLSSLGWEAYHAPDLFQYSTSATLVYPGMQNGVGVKYTHEWFDVYGAALASAWEDDDLEDGAFEGHVRMTGLENFTLFVGGAVEDRTSYDKMLLNIWASYVLGDLTLAAEFNGVAGWEAKDEDGYGWLLMANYKFTEKLGLTLRTSALTIDDASDTTITEDLKFTIAPSYTFTDNFSMVAEFNTIEDVANESTQTYALEGILTF